MGSLENGVPIKRPPLLRSSNSGSRSFLSRPRSRLARLLLFEKVDYLQWICTAATFFFVIILFQAFLPASVVERSGIRGRSPTTGDRREAGIFGEVGGLDFGEGIRFVPSKLLEKFEREKGANLTSSIGRPGRRTGLVNPRLALVLGDLSEGATQLQVVSISLALKEIGYDIEVYALEDGPVYSIWTKAGFSLSILSSSNGRLQMTVDWLNYNGVLISSLGAMPVLSCLSQEPFKFLPIIWIVHERSLALRLENYIASNKTQLINDWKQAFGRATVVVFPTQLMAMMYSVFDAGNYHVLPCSPLETWKANELTALLDGYNRRAKLGYKQEDFVIAMVGSQFSYSGSVLEHAIILQSIAPILEELSPFDLKIGILTENSIGAYTTTLEALAIKFGFSNGSIHSFSPNGNGSSFLGIADVVIYSSFLEEQFFPPVLVQAMSLGKLVVAPDLVMIKKYMDNGLNGYLFSQKNAGMLTQILNQAISNGKLSNLAQRIASMGKELAKNLMASESIEGYAYLLENILKLPSEVSIPKFVTEIPLKLQEEWQWDLFENISKMHYPNISPENQSIVNKIEEKWNSTLMEYSGNKDRVENDTFFSIDWAEEKANEIVSIRKRLLEEELKDRTEQSHGTWEEVYRSVKKAERVKNELHERDDRELERTGQPLCIYEPYFGEGTWPFLHNTSLYRGIGLSTKGRRHGADDIDASSRLPILNSAYYRDTLGDYGAFFALANRIDRIHKNAWIGFQSWRVKAQKASLSKAAEHALLEVIESGRHGDALYFWVRMDEDPRNPLRHDFWTFCDSINAGNCRYAVSETLRRMYGMQLDWNSLPPMPTNGDSWSVMHSWALPTRSFLEFVMFSRMFVDALDAQIYEDHHQNGFCYLSLSKDRHCYSRVLELLVNVWAYHSARRIIYVNPETGVMQEQHKLKNRRGHIWIKWFSYSTLKSMDEDLAEEMDSDHPGRRWLWPSTGEVFWHGIYERERNMRMQQKERKKQQSRDKIRRIKQRARQKTIGKFIKPPPEELGDSNTTTVM